MSSSSTCSPSLSFHLARLLPYISLFRGRAAHKHCRQYLQRLPPYLLRFAFIVDRLGHVSLILSLSLTFPFKAYTRTEILIGLFAFFFFSCIPFFCLFVLFPALGVLFQNLHRHICSYLLQLFSSNTFFFLYRFPLLPLSCFPLHSKLLRLFRPAKIGRLDFHFIFPFFTFFFVSRPTLLSQRFFFAACVCDCTKPSPTRFPKSRHLLPSQHTHTPTAPERAMQEKSTTQPTPTTAQQPTTQRGAEAAVVQASTYALWERLYSPSALSRSVERLMYLRLSRGPDSSCVGKAPPGSENQTTACEDVDHASASSWVSQLFAPYSSVVDAVPATRTAPAQEGTCTEAHSAANEVAQRNSSPAPLPDSQNEEAGDVVAARRASLPFPSTPLPLSNNEERDSTQTMTVAESPPNCSSGSGGEHGTVVLRPSTRQARRRSGAAAAAAEALTPGSVSSPPDWMLPASMSTLASPLMPPTPPSPSRVDQSVQEASTVTSTTTTATTITLVSERNVGGTLRVCEAQSTEADTGKNEDEEKEDMNALREKAAASPHRLSAATQQQAEKGNNEEAAGNVDADRAADSLVSLHTSPVPQPSPGPVVDLADTLTAIPRSGPLFPRHTDSAAASRPPRLSSASPVADRDGLVFSPPRQRQLHLRLEYQQRTGQRRRRPREPSEDNEGSFSMCTTPLSSPSAAPLAFALSPSPPATSISVAAVVEESEEAGAVATRDLRGVPPMPLENEEEGAEEVKLAAGETAAVLKEEGEMAEQRATMPLHSSPLPQRLSAAEAAPSSPDKAVAALMVEEVATHSPPSVSSQPCIALEPLHATEEEEGEAAHRVGWSSTTATPLYKLEVEDARVTEQEEDDEEEEAVNRSEDRVEEKDDLQDVAREVSLPATHSPVLPCGGSPVDVRHTAAALPTAVVHRSSSVREAFTCEGGEGDEERRSAVPSCRSISPSATSSAHSLSPAPRCAQASKTEEDDDGASPALIPRRSVSTMDFTWAAEADAVLRRQQQRLHSQSTARRGCSPVACCGHTAHQPVSHHTDGTGATVSPFPEPQVPLTQGEKRDCDAARSSPWSTSPQPQDPRTRFCGTGGPYAAATATSSARYATSPSRLQKEATTAPISVTAAVAAAVAERSFTGFASPKPLASSPSPHRSASSSASPLSLTPPASSRLPPPSGDDRRRRRQRVAGMKRVREVTSIRNKEHESRVRHEATTASIMTEAEESAVVGGGGTAFRSSPPPPLPPVSNRAAGAVGHRGKQRRGDKAAGKHQLHHDNVGGGTATMRRCRARLNASFSASAATATLASNEFVLPRTASLEPVPAVPSATRAASPLQPRCVNHLQPQKEQSVTSCAKSARTTSPAAPAAPRKRKGKAASAAAGKADADVSVSATFSHRKPSMVALNAARQKQSETSK